MNHFILTKELGIRVWAIIRKLRSQIHLLLIQGDIGFRALESLLQHNSMTDFGTIINFVNHQGIGSWFSAVVEETRSQWKMTSMCQADQVTITKSNNLKGFGYRNYWVPANASIWLPIDFGVEFSVENSFVGTSWFELYCGGRNTRNHFWSSYNRKYSFNFSS